MKKFKVGDKITQTDIKPNGTIYTVSKVMKDGSFWLKGFGKEPFYNRLDYFCLVTKLEQIL